MVVSFDSSHSFYSLIFHRLFGSPKEELLQQQVEELRLQYTMLEKQIDHSTAAVAELRSTDNASYRAVLTCLSYRLISLKEDREVPTGRPI